MIAASAILAFPQHAQRKIQDDLLKYCNDNGVAMAIGIDAQVQQAFDVGIASTLTATPITG